MEGIIKLDKLGRQRVALILKLNKYPDSLEQLAVIDEKDLHNVSHCAQDGIESYTATLGDSTEPNVIASRYYGELFTGRAKCHRVISIKGHRLEIPLDDSVFVVLKDLAESKIKEL